MYYYTTAPPRARGNGKNLFCRFWQFPRIICAIAARSRARFLRVRLCARVVVGSFWGKWEKGKGARGTRLFFRPFRPLFSERKRGIFYHRKRACAVGTFRAFWVLWGNVIFLSLIICGYSGGYFTRKRAVFFAKQYLSALPLSPQNSTEHRSHHFLEFYFRKITGV